MDRFKAWPTVLQRRWLLFCVIGIGFLLVGLVMYLALHDKTLLGISALLALCTALRCVAYFRMVCQGSYETVEGICIELGRVGMKKQRSVRLLQCDGNEYAVMLDKRMPLRIGNCYRFYFSRTPGNAGLDILPQFLGQAQFLGLEDLGEYQPPQEEQP